MKFKIIFKILKIIKKTKIKTNRIYKIKINNITLSKCNYLSKNQNHFYLNLILKTKNKKIQINEYTKYTLYFNL